MSTGGLVSSKIRQITKHHALTAVVGGEFIAFSRVAFDVSILPPKHVIYVKFIWGNIYIWGSTRSLCRLA